MKGDQPPPEPEHVVVLDDAAGHWLRLKQTPGGRGIKSLGTLNTPEPSGMQAGLEGTRGLAQTTSLRDLNNFGSLRGNQEPSSTRTLGPTELNLFGEMVTKAGLDEVHQEYARGNSEVHDSYKHMAVTVGQVKIMFDISRLSENLSRLTDTVEGITQQLSDKIESLTENLSDKVDGITQHLNQLTELVQSTPNLRPNDAAQTADGPVGRNVAHTWACSTELRVCSVSYVFPNKGPANRPSQQGAISHQAHRFITMPVIESYTALESPDRVWLANSLFNRIKSGVRQLDSIRQHLPHTINGVADVRGTKVYNTEIKNVAKHVRKKLHNLLLTGIYDPKNGDVVHGAVPTLKVLVHRIAVKLGRAGDNSDVESVWADTDSVTRCRIAYLRREAVRIFQIGRGSSSIWAAVDQKLHDLRSLGREYTLSFYTLIYQADRTVFDGQTRFQDISANVLFRLPHDDEVTAAIVVDEDNLIDNQNDDDQRF
ncbi:uncharacterized protein MELLADRAFT_93536 [Melampsora larici-populina 98AG31]|uniref:Uncharacterized protein n=1 Tax=Melampsora larici-populina (strain 98AG31 / pathotype 3-4-7) TaxID=747676 RepID=F4RAS3_MELLP|nr:uncharacterized protein MELLADRAFT_93536 [Melampsora larici-populina 98AG31]EGG10729.1 hypothetical protein MELLADRAFT_93536 [Melampsora larici-populina 98AG31]